MKIVFFAPFGIRPKGTVVARMVPLAVELQGRGHEVVIIAPPYTNPEDSGKVELVHGVRLENIKLGGGPKIFSSIVMACRMFRAADVKNPDLIHLFKPKGYGGIAAVFHLFLNKIRRRRYSLFLDTDDWEGQGGMNALHSYSPAERLVFASQERWLPPRFAGVSVASKALMQKMVELGVNTEKILYLPNCVDDRPCAQGASVRLRLNIPHNAPVILLYTRFFEFDQARLHKVFRAVYHAVPSVHFLVVGQGRHGEEQRLMDAAHKGGYKAALHLVGWVEPEFIPDYLAAGDVALYPMDDTLYNRTKCPAKLTELLLAARAVVADCVGQCAEYIGDGQSGILCDPSMPDQMIAAAVELLENRQYATKLGENARQRVLANFNWREQATQLDCFYSERKCQPWT